MLSLAKAVRAQLSGPHPQRASGVLTLHCASAAKHFQLDLHNSPAVRSRQQPPRVRKTLAGKQRGILELYDRLPPQEKGRRSYVQIKMLLPSLHRLGSNKCGRLRSLDLSFENESCFKFQEMVQKLMRCFIIFQLQLVYLWS